MLNENTSPFRIHHFRAPHELTGSNRVHPVAIIGAGPVGLTAALTLARAGIDCVLIEDDDRVCTGSRALGMSRRTLEIWDALGAADRLLAHGVHWKSGRTFHAGQTVLSFDMADDPLLQHRPMFNIQQCHTEHYLLEALTTMPEAEVRWQSRLVGFERPDADDAFVKLEIATPEGRYELKARYVIASDGARSAVRSALGLKLEGESYEANYMIADIALESRSPMERRCWFDPPSNPGLTVLMHGQPDGLWRLDYQLGEDEDAAVALEPARLHERIQKHLDFIGETGPWTLVWHSAYRVHSRALKDFAHGRVAFAGDAAHLMPIFGIRGLNSGVEDAWNLANKLIDIIEHGAPASLLEAYSEERRAVYDENAALAGRNALFMTPPNAGIRLLRDAVLSLSLGSTPVQDIINPRQATYVPLRRSPLSVADCSSDAWAQGPAPGEVLPDLTLASLGVEGPSHLQQIVGRHHVLLCFMGRGNDLSPLRQAFPDVEVVGVSTNAAYERTGRLLVDPDGALHRLFDADADADADAGTAYLVRRDHHVVGRWKAFQPGDIEAAMSLLTGAGTELTTLKTHEGPSLALTPPEQMYLAMGNALDAVAEGSRGMLLMKLALRLGIDSGDPQAFEQAIEAACEHLPMKELT